MDSSAPPPPPRPPPPPPSPPPPSRSYYDGPATPSSISLLIIAIIVGICFVTSVSIFFLIRFFSDRRRRHRRSSSSVAAFPIPIVQPRSTFAVSDASVAAALEAGAVALSEKEKMAVIESLPLFSLASSLAALPKSSPDCAVCLSPFLPDDGLRLIPACRHAFHAACIDNWILVRDTPSCPLCRASITIHQPPLPSAPPLAGSSRSGSFRIEIGSVSLRRDPSNGEEPVSTYSINSEWDYLVEEEVEAVVETASPTGKPEKQPEAGAPAAPAGQVAGAGSGRSSRWLKDYIDRLSSASSSLRVSGRWSNRFDGGGDAAVGRLPSWHWDRSARREAEDVGVLGFYRWLVGAY